MITEREFFLCVCSFKNEVVLDTDELCLQMTRASQPSKQILSFTQNCRSIISPLMILLSIVTIKKFTWLSYTDPVSTSLL